MKQKLFKTMLLLCALIVGSGPAWADEAVCYTLEPASGSNNGYANNCDITINGITWNLTGNSTLQPWRIGGKSLTDVDRALYSKTAISDDITKIVVNHGSASGITVNSMTVIVSKNSDFSDPVSTLTPTFVANGEVTITRPDGKDWSNCYYKFVYNVTVTGSSNKFLEFTKAKFFKEVVDEPEEKEVTFSYVDYQGWANSPDYGKEITMSKTDVDITNNYFYTPQGYSYVRFTATNANGTVTITPKNSATITKVKIITDATYNGGTITPSTGTVSKNTEGTVITWEGSATSAFTLGYSNHICWTSIVVTYTGGAPTCATPVISGETPFVTYSTVSISCDTSGATIYYSTSTDGVIYTAPQVYAAPFQVSTTTQVRAYATKTGLADSEEAYKIFTQQGAAPNIKYFISDRANSGSLEFIRLEDALVTYKNGTTAYLQDAYGAIMLYKCVGDDIAAGDKINGYMHVTGYTVYNNLPEITGFEIVDGFTKTSGNTVTPTVVTIAQLTAGDDADPYESYLSKYIKIENATVTSAFASKNCTISDGTNEIILRDNGSSTLTSTVGDVVTVTGHVSIYGTTKQIAVYEESQIVEGSAPTVPTITVSPSSLTGFTYVVDNGPSAAQSFTVSGTNLTADVTLTLNNSDYEMSLTEADGYASSLTLPQSAGSVAETTIYVRLKEGLTVNASYDGEIAITSTGATSKAVTLSGSVKAPEALNVTWDLSIASYDEITDADIVTWSSPIATVMNSSKSGGTSATNYLGGDSNNRTSSRFYQGNTLTITPASGYSITSVEFTATSTSYATAFSRSEWTNATASASGTLATVTPKDGTTAISATIGGTCGFTSVKVYYEAAASTAPVWKALPTPTINVGEDYELHLTSYVSGNPVPVISLTSGGEIAEFDASDNNYFYFNPTAAGTYEFTFKAENSIGSANATLTVTAVKPQATITLSSNTVEAPAAETDGTIKVTYNNITTVVAEVQFVEDDGTTPATYDWLDAEINSSDNTKLDYVIVANTGAARTAYMKVHAFDNDANDVYSELITINQAAYVEATTYTLASSITPGKHYIIVGYNEKDGSYKAMGVQKSNNRAAVDVTENAGTIAVTTDVCEFVIYGPNANRFYTLYDVAEGYLYAASSSNNYLRSQTTNDINGKWVISIDPGSKIASIFADGSSNRNVMQYNSSSTLFSCYASASQSPVYLYEKDGDTPVATTTSVTLNKYGYATFASTSTLDFLDADKATYGAFELTGVSDSKITFNQITETVAAGTGILLKGNADETITLNILPAGGATLSSNLLEGVTEPKTIADNEYYGLSGNKFVKVGAGTVPAGKALLPASVVGSSIKAFNFVFEDDPDGINSIDNGELTIDNAAIYNLAGQRLSKMQKGINIVNGKKILY